MTKKTTKSLAGHTTRALKALDAHRAVPAAVFLPPALRNGRGVQIHNTPIPTATEHAVRIQNEADPIGMLIAIATGQPVATFRVNEDGEVEAKWETLDLDSPSRMRAVQWLAEKVAPKQTQTITKTIDDTTWEATITSASKRLDDDE